MDGNLHARARIIENLLSIPYRYLLRAYYLRVWKMYSDSEYDTWIIYCDAIRKKASVNYFL